MGNLVSAPHEEHSQWDARLRELEFALNTAVSESTGLAPSEIMLGRKLMYPWKLDAPRDDLVLPGDEDLKDFASQLQYRLARVHTFVRDNLEKASKKQKLHYDKKRRPQEYRVGDLVWRNKHVLSDAAKKFTAKLAHLREGPFEVKEVISELLVMLWDKDYNEIPGAVHVCQLTPYVKPVIPGLPIPAPPKLERGRPKKTHKYNLRAKKQ